MGQPTGHMDRPGSRVATTGPLDDGSVELFSGECCTIMAANAGKLGHFKPCSSTTS